MRHSSLSPSVACLSSSQQYLPSYNAKRERSWIDRLQFENKSTVFQSKEPQRCLLECIGTFNMAVQIRYSVPAGRIEAVNSSIPIRFIASQTTVNKSRTANFAVLFCH